MATAIWILTALATPISVAVGAWRAVARRSLAEVAVWWGLALFLVCLGIGEEAREAGDESIYRPLAAIGGLWLVVAGCGLRAMRRRNQRTRR